MELRHELGRFHNSLGEVVDVEPEYLYPLLKSSDVAKSPARSRERWVILTQRSVADDTSVLRTRAPKLWAYLERHGSLLDGRKSTIYKGRPRFSMFGVGDYSFAPWKVAVSGFYKRLDFTVVGPLHDKPAMLDDTVYFTPCAGRDAAQTLASLLNSPPAQALFGSLVFWDAKRPITVDLLRKLDVVSLARELGRENELKVHLDLQEANEETIVAQRRLF
jgi:hypothetical protein